MKPINRKWLPQTVTLFNLRKAPDTGEMSYYRTFLDGVRIDSRRTTLAASVRGATREYRSMAFIDPVSTQGYLRDQNGRRTPKPFAIFHDWAAFSDGGRAWTLTEGDWLLFKLGEKVTEGPDINGSGLNEQQFRQRYGIRVVSELSPIIDRDGSVHHWEVRLD